MFKFLPFLQSLKTQREIWKWNNAYEMKGLYDLPKKLFRNTFQANKATLHIYTNISNSHIWCQNVANTWKKFTSEIEQFRAAFNIGQKGHLFKKRPQKVSATP